MIYNDGKYHVEKRIFTYLGGYKQADWTIVNTFGELCRRKHITLRFGSKEVAEKYCRDLNETPEGAVLTNLE